VDIACQFCVRRHRKCDGQKPACSNCVKMNNECLYRSNRTNKRDEQFVSSPESLGEDFKSVESPSTEEMMERNVNDKKRVVENESFTPRKKSRKEFNDKGKERMLQYEEEMSKGKERMLQYEEEMSEPNMNTEYESVYERNERWNKKEDITRYVRTENSSPNYMEERYNERENGMLHEYGTSHYEEKHYPYHFQPVPEVFPMVNVNLYSSIENNSYLPTSFLPSSLFSSTTTTSTIITNTDNTKKNMTLNNSNTITNNNTNINNNTLNSRSGIFPNTRNVSNECSYPYSNGTLDSFYQRWTNEDFNSLR